MAADQLEFRVLGSACRELEPLPESGLVLER